MAAFAQHGVAYLRGNWTRETPKITTLLKAYGRSGVPLYLYFAPGASRPAMLPQILTPSIVIGRWLDSGAKFLDRITRLALLPPKAKEFDSAAFAVSARGFGLDQVELIGSKALAGA